MVSSNSTIIINRYHVQYQTKSGSHGEFTGLRNYNNNNTLIHRDAFLIITTHPMDYFDYTVLLTLVRLAAMN